MPTACATLPGAEAWYCKVPHNELPRDPQVHSAVLQLLEDGSPTLAGAPPTLIDHPRSVSDSDLRKLFDQKIDWSALDAVARRSFLDSLNEAPRPSADAQLRSNA